ncbi:uncharacterized protein TNCV_564031 [Trichonephila clavipes]|nr:uncharacterized protein TNCV_564031 [Trichonephila clavipes]
MPLSRMGNTNFAMPSIIDSHDMGLRTVYSPDAQKKTPIQVKQEKTMQNMKTEKEQIKCMSEKFPNLRNRIVNDVVKMFFTDHEEYRNLIHFLESDKEFEFYILKRQKDKPIKAVFKGLPNSSKINDITNDLKVKVEVYLVRGITQCFNCNNFYHTAANCFTRPRCLKCGKDHATRNCHIKERQENPFCINCQDFGHSACYTKCPKFPQPKKVTFYHKVHDFTLLKAHCHPPINDRSIANASCTTIGPPLLKSRPSLKPKFPKPRKSESQIEDRRMLAHPRFLFSKSSVRSKICLRRPRTSELHDLPTIMSDISDIMDFSLTRQSEVAAYEKLRDTVHSISALHSSKLEGARTPTPKNSFFELYQMSTYAMAKKKTNW